MKNGVRGLKTNGGRSTRIFTGVGIRRKHVRSVGRLSTVTTVTFRIGSVTGVLIGRARKNVSVMSAMKRSGKSGSRKRG